ncbi:MAG: biotin--[acetyl-CoA-carboxylase] ligase [Sneathiella sp.]|nr:biotin--[acetyl-CoA-carboxylase] ligase [Sneathiella sp.]
MNKGGGGLTLPPFFSLSAFDTIGSTNEYARELADQGAIEGQLVWSRVQEQGVGRRGREWTSPEGNLYCSLLIRPDCTAAEGAKLSFLVAVALHKTLHEFLPMGSDLALKWPNDLLVNKQKIAGILLESKSNASGNLDWLVIGTGVNIENYPKVTEGLPATCLKKEGGRGSVNRVLESYCLNLLELYTIWQEDGFEPIRQMWLKRATGIGSPIIVRLADKEFSGIFSGLDPSGALILTDNDGSIKHVTAGEIFFPAS